MKERAKVMHSFRFPNGQVATFGWDCQQIPELQGNDSEELRKKIRENSDKHSKLEGFGPLNGFRE